MQSYNACSNTAPNHNFKQLLKSPKTKEYLAKEDL